MVMVVCAEGRRGGEGERGRGGEGREGEKEERGRGGEGERGRGERGRGERGRGKRGRGREINRYTHIHVHTCNTHVQYIREP